MVRQFVEQNGRVARREVAELCRVSSLEARSILKRLVKAEELEQVETGRRAYYVLRREG
jgi:ATP-dependent DNA helicase RecG